MDGGMESGSGQGEKVGETGATHEHGMRGLAHQRGARAGRYEVFWYGSPNEDARRDGRRGREREDLARAGCRRIRISVNE